jgi:hypothetical protein
MQTYLQEGFEGLDFHAKLVRNCGLRQARRISHHAASSSNKREERARDRDANDMQRDESMNCRCACKRSSVPHAAEQRVHTTRASQEANGSLISLINLHTESVCEEPRNAMQRKGQE